MSNAYKCDRCGKYWDRRMFRFNRYIGIGQLLIPISETLQLCKDCYAELKEFLKKGDTNE